MEIVCINNKDLKGRLESGLTIGKTYYAISDDKYRYNIIDDNNTNLWNYPRQWFKTLSEIRNDKIDKLLSDEVTNVI